MRQCRRGSPWYPLVALAVTPACSLLFSLSDIQPPAAVSPPDDGGVEAGDEKLEVGPLPDIIPDTAPLPTTVTDIALTSSSTCITLSTGAVRCWGENEYGQMGDETTTDPPPAFVTTHRITSAYRIAAGQDHYCALLADTTISCWGRNDAQQLGIASSNPCGCVPIPTDVGLVALDGSTVAVAAGGFTTLAIRDHFFHWGTFTGGGVTTSAPTFYPGISDPVDEAHVGSNHACYRTGGTIKCWGANDVGELGRGTWSGPDATPQAVVGLPSATQFAVGDDHTCAVTASGNVYCWGSNGDSKAGVSSFQGCYNNYSCAQAPVVVSLLAPGTAKQVALGSFTSCALMTDGTVQCWGSNDNQAIGATAAATDVPPTQSVIYGVARIELRATHACTIQTDNRTVKCWGSNAHGELGYSTSQPSSGVPSRVAY